MGEPASRSPLSRRLLASALSVLCALEAGAIPASAAVAAMEPAPAPSAAASAASGALGRVAAAAGWVPAKSLSVLAVPAAVPAPAPASDRDGLTGALETGVSAGRLRGAAVDLAASFPPGRRAGVNAWIARFVTGPLNGLPDSATVPAPLLRSVRTALPDLQAASAAAAAASSDSQRFAQTQVEARVERMTLPDFARHGAPAAVPHAAPAPYSLPGPAAAPFPRAAAPLPSDLGDRLGQRGDLSRGPSDPGALARLDALRRRADAALGPADPRAGLGGGDSADSSWASVEALKRLFSDIGASPAPAAPAGPPLPPAQARAVETEVSRVEALKAELQAGIARRDAAEAMLSVAQRARDAALAQRRSGKDDLEFRKNFSQLAMVMDLSYSLNLLNSADAAIARMQGLLDQKVKSISDQRAANDAARAAAGAQGGNADKWKQEAKQSADADRQQAGDFASLAADVGKLADSVGRFKTDVPALLAAIDARDKGRSANAVAEYDRRLALLPSLTEQLKTAAYDPAQGVASLSMSYLKSKSQEIAADRALLSGADAQLAAAPVEYAPSLVIVVPGVPSESLSNPSPSQVLAMLERRRAFWQSQLDEHEQMLASVKKSLDPSDSEVSPDSFGDLQPVSLAAWRQKELSLDGTLAAAEAPMAAAADADEAAIEAAVPGVSLRRLSAMSPDDMRTALPDLLDALSSLSMPDTDAGFAAKAAYLDLARLVAYLGDATARRLEARATADALKEPVESILPQARDAFSTAVDAWRAVLDDVSADEAYVKAGAPPAQGQALIDRKRALLKDRIAPALDVLQKLVDGVLIPYQNTRIAQADPSSAGDGYQTLYTQKKALYEQIADGLHQTLPWALASDGAKPYDAGAARAGIANLRSTYDKYLGVVNDYLDEMRRRTDPNDAGTEDVYGEQAPYSLVKREKVYAAERAARTASLNARAAEINDLLGKMDALGGTSLLADWKLPTGLADGAPATADKLNAVVDGNVLQNMAAAIQAVADKAQAAGGAPSVGVGGGGTTIPTGNQPPLDVSKDQKIALYGLEVVKRLVPSTATGGAGDAYAQSLARYLFADALVSTSDDYLKNRIPLFQSYLSRAKTALNSAEADLDQDLAWVAGDRSGGDAVLARKAALFASLTSILNEGAGLFGQKAAWDEGGSATAERAASYYSGLDQTYASGDQALDAELTAAKEFQDALAKSRSDIDSQRTEVVGWLKQLNDPNESALSRVAQNMSTIQDKTRAVLETNVSARRAQRARDEAAASVEETLRALSAERSTLDTALGQIGSLSRLTPELAARAREAVGQGGAWLAEGPTGPQTLVIPKSKLEAFLTQLFSAISPDSAARDLASLRASILKDPSALAQLIPGSKVVQVGSGADGFYLVYQTEFSTPGGLETESSATLGNIAKVWGQNVSLIGYRFASPPSPGNAPWGDQGVTVQVESLDSDHAVNYLDVTFHKFVQDIPSNLTVGGQAQEARMMVFDDFALLMAGGKVYFGAAGFADVAASGAAQKPQYYGANLKASVKFTQVLSLNAEETALLAKDPRKFLQTVNLDFTKYDPSLDQSYIVSGSGDTKTYRRDKIGVGVDLGKALGQKDSFTMDLYYAHTAGTDDVTQSAVGATILKGFTFDVGGQPAKVTVGGGAEAGQKQDAFNGRVSFELPNQGVALTASGKIIGSGSSYYAQLQKKLGDHSDASIAYGSPYIGLNNRLSVSFSSTYTLAELWRAATGQSAADLAGGRALADFDKTLADFFTRGASDRALTELSRVYDADVGRKLIALEIGRMSRDVETLRRAGAVLDNTRQTAMVGFVSNPIGPGTAEQATGGGFQVGTETQMTLTRTQRAAMEKESAELLSLGLDMEERLLDLTKQWQQALADLAVARWRELLAGWLAAHADDAVLRAEAEADAAAAADARRQAELRYAALTGRGPEEIPAFEGVAPQDFDKLLAEVSAATGRAGRVGALLARARETLKVDGPGFNALDWAPWIEKLTLSFGAQIPELLSSQPLGAGVSVTLPVYDPARKGRDAAMRLQAGATLQEMAARLQKTRSRARGETLAARAWAQRADDQQALEKRTAQELSDAIRQYRNGLIQASELRARARAWRETVDGALQARVQADLEDAWASLDGAQSPTTPDGLTRAQPADMRGAFDQAAKSAPDLASLARRSLAARQLLDAADHRIQGVSLELDAGANLTATGIALIPALGVTGLGVWPILGVDVSPDELTGLETARRGAEAGLYSRLADKASADSALSVTRAAVDGSFLDREIALYRATILPQLERAQDGSSDRALALARARGALADLVSRRGQTALAMNQLLGRPLDATLTFAPDPGTAVAAFQGRAAALDPVAAARDALESRVKIARAVEAEVDKGLKVDQLRLEPISLIGKSLGRLVAALSGDPASSPELMQLARERTLDAERALEAFDAQVPAMRARLAVSLSATRAARAALAGHDDAASRLQDLELGRQEALLEAQLAAWGGPESSASDGSLPGSYAQLEDRLKEAERAAQFPTETPDDSGALSSPKTVEMSGTLRWYDARQTLGGDPIGRQFAEGWVEARLRSPSTPPEALAALATLRRDAADERRSLDTASADEQAELLLARLRLSAGLMRWSEGMGLGSTARARASADLAQAAALLRLPADVPPARLLDLMPAQDGGDLAAVAERYEGEAEGLDLDALGRTLFAKGLPPELTVSRDALPQLRADLIAEKMSSRGFTPVAAFGLFKGQWVQGAFLQAPDPEAIQNALTEVLDDALRRELESRDRLKSLGLLLHALMASVADKTRLVAAARLREIEARRALSGTLERVRLGMAPVSEAAAAAQEAQDSQEAFVSALFALKEDFARLTTELTALGVKPASYLRAPAPAAPALDEPGRRTARERLLAYWADRMQDPDFERRVEDLLSGQPGSVIASLRELSARYRTAAQDDAAVRARPMSAAERLDLLTKTDLQGRRRAIEAVLGRTLDGLQGADPAHSPAWASLMGFLRDDVSARAVSGAEDLARADALRGELRSSYLKAAGAPPELAAELKTLEGLQSRADAARREALAAWLARRGSAQDQVLKDKALDAYVSALDALDAELQKAMETKAASADAGWVRVLDSLYGVRESLARRADRLRYGRGLLSIDAAMMLDEARLRAQRFSNDENRDVEPAAEELAYLRDLREKWTGRPDALPALVALRGTSGTDWATVADLARDAKLGRVATIGGRRFLAPADAAGDPPKTAAAALSNGWREVIEGEDAARERLAQARARREDAAREAALSALLRTSEVAVTDGSDAGPGRVLQTLTLADLRALEDAGRALWFEASPDPATGLRAAVPAVAARWRDPAELTLMIETEGDAPAPGRYPTLESLLAAKDGGRWARARIGAAGLKALDREAAEAALAARREGWLKLKLNAWGFALAADGSLKEVYLSEDELSKAAAAARDPKDPGHDWRFLRVDQVALGLAADGTLVAVRVADRTFALGDGAPARWIQAQPLALETDARGRVTRLFQDRKALDAAAAGWNLQDSQGRTWTGAKDLPPLLRAQRWTDPSTGLTVSLGRDLLDARRRAAMDGAAGAAHWAYSPRQIPSLITEIPRGIVQTPLEIFTGRDPNQQGYLGGVYARRGEGGASVARSALGKVLSAIDLFGFMNDPVDRYFDPSQYPDAVRRDAPVLPDGSAGDAGMKTPDGKKTVFYGVGSFTREARWASEDLEASRDEILAAFQGGVRRETVETVRGRAGDYADSTVRLEVGRGASLAAIDQLGARLDPSGAASVSDAPRRAAVDRVDQVVGIVAGADTQDARRRVYEAALKRLADAPVPEASDAEIASASAALKAALAARRAVSAAVAAVSPAPNLPGYPVAPALFARLKG
jgi:hypothetical protein